MTRTTRGLLVLVTLLVACGGSGGEPADEQNAHGVFTGEIKAVIYVSDVEKSAPFYRDVLGFEFQGFAGPAEEPYYAEMVVAGVKFGLHEPTSEGQEAKVGQQRLYFRLRDLPAHRARVLAWGGKAGEIKKTAWMDMFIARDPDGNEIVFAVTDPEQHSINPWDTRDPATGRDEKP